MKEVEINDDINDEIETKEEHQNDDFQKIGEIEKIIQKENIQINIYYIII